MSKLALGIRLYRHIPPPTEGGTTARDIASAMGLTPRTIQRHLVALEHAALVRREPGATKPEATRWWRA